MTNIPPHDVTITRYFDASPELVFRAWTDPRLMAQWFGPRYFTIPHCEVDAVPGGRFHIDMQGPDGTIYPNKGIFHEVIPPERLVLTSTAFEEEGGGFQLEVLNTVTFDQIEDGRTRMTLHAVVVRAVPEVYGALAGMEQGWSESFDKLAQAMSEVEL
jgi:uncharacterized protein YndB with AHSA1/START domain